MNTGGRVLVVDDEEPVLAFLRTKLKVAGYEALTARDGKKGLEQLKQNQVDLVILDIVMPVMDGWEMLKELRSFSDVPVIMLSALSGQNIVRALNAGADDYVTKPFNPDELLVRIKAVMRRAPKCSLAPKKIFIGGNHTTLNLESDVLVVDGKEKTLTPIDHRLLVQFLGHLGRVMTYDNILIAVWGPEYRGDTSVLWTAMSRLRTKLKELGIPLITSVRKTGYLMKVQAWESVFPGQSSAP